MLSHLATLFKKSNKCLALNQAADKTFTKLKTAFTTAPTPDLEVSSSNGSCGKRCLELCSLNTLKTSSHIIQWCSSLRNFFSKKSAETNYDIGNRELLAVKLTLEEWCRWLEGTAYLFMIFIDDKKLEYLKLAKHLIPCQAWWALFFTRFIFMLSY